MKPWFNTTLIVMILIINLIVGYQLHTRIKNLEMMDMIWKRDITNSLIEIIKKND